MHAFPPVSLALVRFAVASVVLAGFWWWRRRGSGAAGATRETVAATPRLTRGEWIRLAIAGFFTIGVYQTSLNAGSRTVTAGVACLLVNTGPIFTAIAGMLFLGERLGLRGWAGLLCGFAGVLVVARGMGAEFEWAGDAGLVMLAAVAQAAWFGVSKPLLSKHGAFEVTCRTVWLGVLFLLPFTGEAWNALRAAPPEAVASVIYLGVFPGAIGYITWSYTLSRMPASRAASLLYLVPPIAFTIAWIALGEQPTLLAILGGIPIVAGVALVNTGRRQSARRTSSQRPSS